MTTPADDPNKGGQPGAGGTPPGGDPPRDNPPAKTFTQEEVNRMMGTARAEGRSTALEGVNLDQLRADAAKGKELQEAAKTDLERATARAEEAEKTAAAATASAQQTAVTSEIRVQASVLGGDPDAVAALVDRTGISYIGQTGAVAGAKEAVEALLTAKPHLVMSKPQGAPNSNPGGKATPVGPATLTAQQKLAARVMGQSEEEYAKALGDIDAAKVQPDPIARF